MPLHRLTLTVALLASAFVNAFAADAITPTAKTELFNGKDTVGWVVYPAETSKDTWSIKDGISPALASRAASCAPRRATSSIASRSSGASRRPATPVWSCT